MTQTRIKSLQQAAEIYYNDLRNYIRRRTGSASLAEDVVQETWIRAHGASEIRPANPRAYLFRMASNLAIDHLRRQRRRSTVECPDPAEDAVSGIGAAQVAASDPGPEAILASRQELAILNAAVQDLPDRCRQVFLMHRRQGLTMRQIAEQLDISEKTVEKHIARALLECRERLRAAGRRV